MKRLLVTHREFLIDDSAAEALIQYAAVSADLGRADTVELEVATPEGTYTRISLLLAAGTQLAAASVQSAVKEPDNARIIEQLWQKIAALKAPRSIPGDTADHFIDLDVNRS